MRLQYLLLGTAIALGSAVATDVAMSAPAGWYMSLGAGANWIPDGDITEVDGSAFGSSTDPFTWDTGFIGTGALGYKWNNHWRAEFEVAYRSNEADSFCEIFVWGTDCTNDVENMDIWELSQMVNVFYDFDLGGNWSASAGAGIGGNLVVLHPAPDFDGDAANNPDSVNGDDYVLAGQLIAELAYQFSERWQVYADYRYMIMDDPSMQNPGDFDEIWEVEKSDHSLLIGIRFDLQRDGMAPPPPPPPPGKGPRQFIVFFGFNKSNLTAEAARVVEDAAAAAKEYGSASITVIGHTDSSGSTSYNVQLSLRRSQAVKSGLVAAGVPASMISTSGRGESELMVQTGDGVKEPQNRRATIDLN